MILFLIFLRKLDLTCHANCLLRSQFVWHVKSIFWTFSYFSRKWGFDMSCKLSTKETICMTYQIHCPRKNKKSILKYYLLEFLPCMLSIDIFFSNFWKKGNMFWDFDCHPTTCDAHCKKKIFFWHMWMANCLLIFIFVSFFCFRKRAFEK